MKKVRIPSVGPRRASARAFSGGDQAAGELEEREVALFLHRRSTIARLRMSHEWQASATHRLALQLGWRRSRSISSPRCGRAAHRPPAEQLGDPGVVLGAVEAQPLRRRGRRFRRSIGTDSSVGPRSFESCRWAPSGSSRSGGSGLAEHRALCPLFALSVGLGRSSGSLSGTFPIVGSQASQDQSMPSGWWYSRRPWCQTSWKTPAWVYSPEAPVRRGAWKRARHSERVPLQPVLSTSGVASIASRSIPRLVTPQRMRRPLGQQRLQLSTANPGSARQPSSGSMRPPFHLWSLVRRPADERIRGWLHNSYRDRSKCRWKRGVEAIWCTVGDSRAALAVCQDAEELPRRSVVSVGQVAVPPRRSAVSSCEAVHHRSRHRGIDTRV
jgi:hypothetical protein